MNKIKSLNRRIKRGHILVKIKIDTVERLDFKSDPITGIMESNSVKKPVLDISYYAKSKRGKLFKINI